MHDARTGKAAIERHESVIVAFAHAEEEWRQKHVEERREALLDNMRQKRCVRQRPSGLWVGVPPPRLSAAWFPTRRHG